MNETLISLPADYANWLTSLKQRIQGARQRALLSANAEQIRLYHDLGRDILERQSREKWGAKVIEHLSADLRAAFPDIQAIYMSPPAFCRIADACKLYDFNARRWTDFDGRATGPVLISSAAAGAVADAEDIAGVDAAFRGSDRLESGA